MTVHNKVHQYLKPNFSVDPKVDERSNGTNNFRYNKNHTKYPGIEVPFDFSEFNCSESERSLKANNDVP